ncbi:glycosyltransferase family 1 protein [Zhihengliuella sp.]|uniref:glycosyltransferase family 4 protein n=1 Tax=Zhihengliuella sp. TaxID=1954483 RepID=UPI0028124760|nr:glycosyltransferase family 1 protein [Zhihengliuella sp.]
MTETTAVVVNGRFLGQPVTGVQRFAEEVTAALLQSAEFPVEILVPRGVRPRADGPLVGVPVTEVGRTRGHLWEQVDLPLHLKRHGSPLLIGLSSTAPVWYRRQFAPHHDVTYVRYPESFSWRFRLLYRALAPLFLKRAMRIITVSQFSRSEIAAHFGVDREKIVVVPNAPSAIFAQRGLASDRAGKEPAERPYFLAVSSPNIHKNFDRLEQAFEAFAAQHGNDIELRIIGQQASSFAKRDAPHSSRVRYLGRVTDPELADAYAGALAFVFPSLYEGFGIPPLEAQAAGAPVIASRAASMPEVLGESVLYIDPLDTASITAGMTELAGSPEVRAALRARGFENAARFSWESSATLLVRELRRAADIT